jgi:abhydrolase domain-containing protein 12
VLRSLGYHIIAFDYRGYGDSTGTPTELDVVKDALYTHDYIRKRVPWATIYIWGHSLGTGIASHMARMLTETNQPPPGIVLEAPFFNIVEEVEFHPFFWVFYFNSLVLTAIEDSLLKINLQFRSDIQ